MNQRDGIPGCGPPAAGFRGVRHRLFIQVYLAFVGITVLCLGLAFGAMHLGSDREGRDVPPPLGQAALRLGRSLPGPERPIAELRREVRRAGEELQLLVTVRDGKGGELARHGPALPDPGGDGPRWIHARGLGVGVGVRLPDGRRLAVSPDRWWKGGGGGRHALGLLVIAGAFALGTWPLARRITRRIEALRRGVEDLGAGDLGRRVAVHGTDEVADLARAFNAAADRIQALVESQRRVLASASHELRSPLARVRLAVEMLGEDGDEGAPGDGATLDGGGPGPGGAEGRGSRRRRWADEAARDVAELDALIGDLLLASRLRARDLASDATEVDLSELVAGEAARAGAAVAVVGEAVPVRGDARALRRLVRNLVDNAVRHGGGEGVEVVIEPLAGGGARIAVCDRGPGVPEEERERIFEPFYRPPGHREGADGGVGLGLALVREVAAAHHGSARCEPREGGGSRFVVEVRPR